MKTILALTFASLLPVAAATAAQVVPAPREIIESVGFDQRLGEQVPLDAAFRDEQGRPVRLRGYLHGDRPALLVLGYHDCPMLCSVGLTGLTEGLNDLRATTGKDFDFIDLSINPRETPERAAAKKRLYFKRYLRAGADVGWHFLTGEETEIRRVAEAVGFRYRLDPATGQYAHASGVVVLTPDGRVAKYLLGVNYPGEELQAALATARAGRVGSPIERLLLLCFHYNPISGRYGPLIFQTMRVAGVVTLLVLGSLLARLWWREHRDRPPLPGA